MLHLTDETLNEYLDGELPADRRAEAGAHLDGCAPCTRRLDQLRRMYAQLAAVPEAPLGRDLTAGVLGALEPSRKPKAEGRRAARAPRRVWGWVLGAQAVGAAALLALAWPFAAGALGPWLDPTAGAGWLGQARAWLAAVADPVQTVAAAGAALQAWVTQAAGALNGDWLAERVGPAEAGLLTALAAGGWVLGNALLLRRAGNPLRRRRS